MPTVARTADSTSPQDAGAGASPWAPARLGLLIGGAVLALVYVVLLFVKTTSTVTEKTPQGVTTKITDTEALYPEATSSVVIGAAVLLLIVAALYNRITKITGPGGIAVEFSDVEKKQAAAAVSDAVKEKASPLKEKATSPQQMSEPEAVGAARDIAAVASGGTLDVLEKARSILKQAASSPSEALETAVNLGVSKKEAAALVYDGRTSDELWRSLAGHVVNR